MYSFSLTATRGNRHNILLFHFMEAFQNISSINYWILSQNPEHSSLNWRERQRKKGGGGLFSIQITNCLNQYSLDAAYF